MSPVTLPGAEITASETRPIFLSYASSDRPYVERLVKTLEAAHHRCWVSYRDIGIGENYQAAISRALRSAKVLIVILSRNANASVEIPKELSLASRNRLTIMPLRVDAAPPSDALAYELATRQWIDLFDDWEPACHRLLSQLAAILPRWPSAPPPPRPALSPHRAAPPVSAAGVSASAAHANGATPTSDGPFIGFIKFAIVAGGFASQLYLSLGDGGPSLLELLFWAIFLPFCARIVGGLLRGFAAVSRDNHQETLINQRAPAPT